MMEREDLKFLHLDIRDETENGGRYTNAMITGFTTGYAKLSLKYGRIVMIEVMGFEDLQNHRPDPDSLIAGRGWIKKGSTTLMIGPTGMGKSVLAEQIAVSVASGLAPIPYCLSVTTEGN